MFFENGLNRMTKLHDVAGKAGLSVGTLLLCLGLLEIGCRIYFAVNPDKDPARITNPLSRNDREGVSPPPMQHIPDIPVHIVLDSKVLYGLNPKHPEINSIGLRSDEVEIPKPKGTFRILVLGDSVTFGFGVAQDKAFPSRLQAILKKKMRRVEVINAGVSGYTAYNEVEYYLSEGRKLAPDVVIVGFCLNDVVNPRLHWGYAKERIVRIPDEAIPNLEYDRNHIIPLMKQLRLIQKESREDAFRLSQSPWNCFALFRFVQPRAARFFRNEEQNVLRGGTGGTSTAEGTSTSSVALPPGIPVFLTMEDMINVSVLMDDNSQEMQWLRSMYDRLKAAVVKDGAKLMIAIFPLNYQVDRSYPLSPQTNLLKYCEQNAIPCDDVLNAFVKFPKEQLYRWLPPPGQGLDPWHFSEFGHEICAEELANFLESNHLLTEETHTDPLH